MKRYKHIAKIGDGSFGTVYRSIALESGQTVAIKSLKQKYFSWDECVSLKEVSALIKLSHPNIVKLKEVVRQNDELFLVFEYMKCNLYQLLKQSVGGFTEAKIRSIMYQCLQGLSHSHRHNIMHRDIKPENILVSDNRAKLADFGLAKAIRSKPPFTEYVSTRWYRAPEVLLRAKHYSSPIDLWAMGLIMAELYSLRPLMPGSSEIDQLYRVCAVLGPPNDWPEGQRLGQKLNIRWPSVQPASIGALVGNASPDAIRLITDMLKWNPRERPTAMQALQYPFFTRHLKDDPSIPAPLSPPGRRQEGTNLINQNVQQKMLTENALPSLEDGKRKAIGTVGKVGTVGTVGTVGKVGNRRSGLPDLNKKITPVVQNRLKKMNPIARGKKVSVNHSKNTLPALSDSYKTRTVQPRYKPGVRPNVNAKKEDRQQIKTFSLGAKLLQKQSSSNALKRESSTNKVSLPALSRNSRFGNVAGRSYFGRH
ncbi:hypothetical protein PCE1_001110 [Barthelona sp. PCE]